MTLFGDEHVRKYQETDGAEGYHWQKGTTILLLSTTGRKSGKERTSALIYRDWNDKQLIVASNGGNAAPAWFLNLSDDPNVQVQIKDDKFAATARVATPDEKPEVWELMVQAWPDYANYQAKADRDIPVVVLDRA